MIKSLAEIHASIPIKPHYSWWRKFFAFAGPGYLVAVGYMDPGNWATDLAGGSTFGYTLLSVILASNVMAMILQHLSVKLGIVSGRDLAQACRDNYSPRMRWILWLMAEVAITACDLAEVIGSAIALQLLFGWPIMAGVILTSLDVLILLLLQNRGLRYLEILVISLISVIIGSFALEIFWSQPSWLPLVRGFLPTIELLKNREMLYISIGILGATVMPHNLYLHSALVQTRGIDGSEKSKKEAIFFATLDSSVALSIAFFVNAAILIVSAAAFYVRDVGVVAEIQDAYHLLSPVLGVGLASLVFALALLSSGHNSTITGTLAGQVVMEGFINLRLKPWQRRLLTRLLAIVPALLVVWLYGAHGLARLLVLSQVVLSLQLPFAVIPLVAFTSDQQYLGRFANSSWLKISSWAIAGIITVLNLWLIVQIIIGE